MDLSLFKEFEKRQKASLQKAKKEAEAKKDGAAGVENIAIVGSNGN